MIKRIVFETPDNTYNVFYNHYFLESVNLKHLIKFQVKHRVII